MQELKSVFITRIKLCRWILSLAHSRCNVMRMPVAEQDSFSSLVLRQLRFSNCMHRRAQTGIRWKVFDVPGFAAMHGLTNLLYWYLSLLSIVFKQGLLAKSCLCPGFSTLVSNLITSSNIEAQVLHSAHHRPHDFIYVNSEDFIAHRITWRHGCLSMFRYKSSKY